ncbi:MAG: DUF480 domain-containing protein, partial [Acidobacteria bacterium]|nr:DUF480 domain-containing protein [Acidobacteriota bacterium]
NACNQKNNRDPTMTLDEDSVRQALSSLGEKRLAGPAGGAESRVAKYEHRLQEVFNFDRREIAVLTLLLLRGPQTPGELRGRAERMYRFETLEDIQSTLRRLIEREPPLVRMLSRQPGTKESRFMHLFFPESQADIAPLPPRHPGSPDSGNLEERVGTLEGEVSLLRRQLEELGRELREFKKLF